MGERVVIVGAGPVGMVLACELLRQGIEVRLVDGAREHSAHSRATIVWPRLLELLHHTGLTERIVAESHRIDGMAYFSSGRRLGTAWMNRLRDTAYPFAAAIPQSRTEEIIEGRLAELGGKIERGVRLAAIGDPDGPRPVAVLVGPDGTTTDVETSWLVGADGAHSTVRKLVGDQFEGEQFDVSFAVTDAEVIGDAPMDVVSYCYTGSGSLALGPLGGNVCRVAVSVPHQDDDTPPSRDFFQSIVDERGPGRNLLGELRFSVVFRVHARIAARFRYGHVLLAGDAAHVMSPAGAQGMNTGLQDSVDLGWRLGGVLRDELDASALTDYDVERRKAAHDVARATALQTRWGLLRKRSHIALRDTAIRAASATGPLQRTIAPMVAQTGVRYPAVPGTTGPARGRIRPGQRLPVLPSHDADPAWTTVSPARLTVLAWPGRRPGAAWPAAVERASGAVDGYAEFVEATWRPGPLATALGSAATFAVVRPDGHLHAAVAPGQLDTLTASLRSAHLREGGTG